MYTSWWIIPIIKILTLYCYNTPFKTYPGLCNRNVNKNVMLITCKLKIHLKPKDTDFSKWILSFMPVFLDFNFFNFSSLLLPLTSKHINYNSRKLVWVLFCFMLSIQFGYSAQAGLKPPGSSDSPVTASQGAGTTGYASPCSVRNIFLQKKKSYYSTISHISFNWN